MTGTTTYTDKTFIRDLLIISGLIGLAFALQTAIASVENNKTPLQNIQQRIVVSKQSNDNMSIIDLSNKMVPNSKQELASFNVINLYPAPMANAESLNMITPASGGE